MSSMMSEVCPSVSVEPLLNHWPVNIPARGFWKRNNKHSSMSRLLTLIPKLPWYPIGQLLQEINVMSCRRSDHMRSVSAKWSMGPSPSDLSSRLNVALAKRLRIQHCTGTLNHWFPPRNCNHTRRRWTGSDVLYDWICSPQSNNHVPDMCTLQFQSRGQKQCCWSWLDLAICEGEDLAT